MSNSFLDDMNESLGRSQVEWQMKWLKLKLWLEDQHSEGRIEFVARLVNPDAIGNAGAIVIECSDSFDCIQISLKDS